jgi:putative transposase
MQGGYQIRNQAAIHFLTFTVVEWADVFTRKEYKDILLDSLRYCQHEKGLLLHCWCLMTNHLHLIASAKNHDLSSIVRDFKKFTSTKIIRSITDHPKESRKEWLLRIFKEQGQQNLRNTTHQFWIQDNHPVELWSSEFILQKLNYIHNNPVEAGIVHNPWEYVYSSAKDYHETRRCGLLELQFL